MKEIYVTKILQFNASNTKEQKKKMFSHFLSRSVLAELNDLNALAPFWCLSLCTSSDSSSGSFQLNSNPSVPFESRILAVSIFLCLLLSFEAAVVEVRSPVSHRRFSLIRFIHKLLWIFLTNIFFFLALLIISFTKNIAF